MTTTQPAALPERIRVLVNIQGGDMHSTEAQFMSDDIGYLVRVPREWQPAALQPHPAAADWQTPTTYAQRFASAVGLLCREMPPADMVAGWIDRASDDHRLQDWACERAPAWAQGIGLLDAAHVMADQPTEGVDHEPAQPAAAVSDEEISRLWSWSATAEAERTATTQQHAFAYALLALRPQAVPMTGEQRQQAFNNSWATSVDFFAGIVAAEAHHGITAQGAQGGEG